MTSKVNPIPAGYTTVTPYLIMQNAADAIEFYKKAFNAVENFRMLVPAGTIGHAEIKIGNAMVMLADECAEMKLSGPKKLGGTPVSLHLYVDNVDEWFKRAVTAGGKEIKPVEDQFYGDRMGVLQDPFGHMWTLSTHVEDLSMEEIKKRMDAMFTIKE